jgi:hypothetical protein
MTKMCSCQRLEPRHFEITRDDTFQRNNLLYVFIYVNGSWQIELNGIMIMPGNFAVEEYPAHIFNGTYNIRFVRDFSQTVPDTNPEIAFAVQDNPNLKTGQFVYVRYASVPEKTCNCS